MLRRRRAIGPGLCDHLSIPNVLQATPARALHGVAFMGNVRSITPAPAFFPPPGRRGPPYLKMRRHHGRADVYEAARTARSLTAPVPAYPLHSGTGCAYLSPEPPAPPGTMYALLSLRVLRPSTLPASS